MTKEEFAFIAVSELRLGLMVDLDVGWLKHPFPKSRFRISSLRQIETLQLLGLERVRYVPALSEPAPEPEAPPREVVAATEAAPAHVLDLPPSAAQRPQDPLRDCEQHFAAAAQAYSEIRTLVPNQLQQAAERSQQVVKDLLDSMLPHGELAIRMLQGPSADAQAMHPVNVAVLSLLLGKLMGLPRETLTQLGLAAYLHDLGKQALPERLRFARADFSAAEQARYQDHVALGVQWAREMGLSGAVQGIMAQHHAYCDATGFPEQTPAPSQATGLPERILALVNQYDNLCNPPRAGVAATPHEALALMFTRMKSRFDGPALAAFIRMMGVYPPGSMVQLQDDRYAMVVAVHASRPLKPRVLVYASGVPRSDAIFLDLEQLPGAGIRRSLRPNVLPENALRYLAPPRQACYFFEPANQPSTPFQSM